MIHPHRSKNHLAFVRARPCVFCPRPACEAHHAFRNAGGGGMGIKGCDLLTVPLCREHHRELHKTGTVGERTSEASRGEMWQAVAMQLRERLLDGPDPNVCWHCLDVLEPATARCEKCPEECDDLNCAAEGCRAIHAKGKTKP